MKKRKGNKCGKEEERKEMGEERIERKVVAKRREEGRRGGEDFGGVGGLDFALIMRVSYHPCARATTLDP